MREGIMTSWWRALNAWSTAIAPGEKPPIWKPFSISSNGVVESVPTLPIFWSLDYASYSNACHWSWFLRWTQLLEIFVASHLLRNCICAMSSPPSSFDPDHFPVRLNHSLNDGQHTILRKLGEGLSSSSWLVHNNKGKWVSLHSAASSVHSRRLRPIDQTQTSIRLWRYWRSTLRSDMTPVSHANSSSCRRSKSVKLTTTLTFFPCCVTTSLNKVPGASIYALFRTCTVPPYHL